MKRSLGLIALFAAANINAEETLPTVDCVISPSKVVDVGTAVSGVIERVNVGLGDQVSSDQLLVELEAGVEKATVKLATARASMKADLSAEQVNLRYDRLQAKRVDQLAARSLASSQNKDEASRIKSLSYWRTEQVREELHLRELELARAKAQLEEKRIYSVVNGVVAEQFKEEGEYVEDQPILRLVQLNPLHVNAVFPMHLYQRIKVGMQAEIFPETDQKQGYPVVVDRLDPIGDAASGTFGVRLTLDNSTATLPAGLKCFLQVDENSALVASTEPNQVPHQQETLEEKSENPHVVMAASHNSDIKDQLEANSSLETNTEENEPNSQVIDENVSFIKHEPDRETTSEPINAAEVVSNQHSNVEPLSVELTDQKSNEIQMVKPAKAVSAVKETTFGPFADKDQFVAVEQQLNLADVSYAVKEERATVTNGYIVLSSKDYKQLPSVLFSALEQKGVTDMMRLPKKSYQGRISFGTYNGPVQAKKRQKELHAIGVKSELIPRQREKVTYWLHVPELPADLPIQN